MQGAHSSWQHWLPGLAVARSYERAWLRHDLAAGLVLAAMLVPVGIAYAQAAGVPGIYGLYASIVPLLVYAVFGPSRILVLGPDSALVAVIFAVVAPLAAGDPQRAIALASAMAVVAGIVGLAAGLARLGFITELISKPIRYGYMNGIALTMILSQTPKLLGFSIDVDGPVSQVRGIVQAVLAGKTNLASLAVGGSVLVAILLLRRFRRFPTILLAVIAATVAVALLDLEGAGVKVIGTVPQGLPGFTVPMIRMEDLQPVLIGGLAVALVAFADTSVLSRTYAARLKQPADPNREMVGLGLANIATGFFQGIAVSSSSSRTPVAEAAGARTQLTGVVAALCIAVLLVAAPNLMQDLPIAALAAVVITSALGLIEVADLRRIYRMQRWEFWLSLVCTVGVATLGAIQGIGIAVAIAVAEFLWDGWRPHSAVLGRVEGLKGYHDVTRYPEASRIPGLVLFRWDAPLFFANAELFRDRVLAAVASSPTPVRQVVVAAEPVTSVDVTAADLLEELDASLRERGMALVFAEMKDPVKDKLKRFGLFAQFGADTFHPTLGEAVKAYLRSHPVPWEDWEDAGRAAPQQRDSL